MKDVDELKEKKMEEKQQPAVKVYTTPTCPYCDQVKKYLKQKDVDFVEYNVAENKERAKEMIEKTGQRGVPVTVINDEAIVGFNQEAIDQALQQ